MSSFKPNKRHLQELLIYFFNLKKSAASAHRLLVVTYHEAVLGERSCRKWFQEFKNGEFDIEDKKRSGRPKVYEEAELEALLDQDSCQTQEVQYDGRYLRIKHKVPFFHNTRPIFSKTRRKLICIPDTSIDFSVLCQISRVK